MCFIIHFHWYLLAMSIDTCCKWKLAHAADEYFKTVTVAKVALHSSFCNQNRNYLVPALSLLNRDIIAAFAWNKHHMYIFGGSLDQVQTLTLYKIDFSNIKELPVWPQHIECDSRHSRTSPGNRIKMYVWLQRPTFINQSEVLTPALT